jgi:hypothetical protein
MILDIVQLCSLSVDLKELPERAFQKKVGWKGVYYKVNYEIAMTFGTELEFKFLWEGDVKGVVKANYN